MYDTRAFPGVSRQEVENTPNDVEDAGDRTHPFSSENDHHWMEGAGILLGVFGRARCGVNLIVAGVLGCECDGGHTGGGGKCPVREDEQMCEGVL